MTIEAVHQQVSNQVCITTDTAGDAGTMCARDFANLGLDHGYTRAESSALGDAEGEILFHPLTKMERGFCGMAASRDMDSGGFVRFGRAYVWQGQKWLAAVVEFPFKPGDPDAAPVAGVASTPDVAYALATRFSEHIQKFSRSLGGMVILKVVDSVYEIRCLFLPERLFSTYDQGESWREAFCKAASQPTKRKKRAA
jgi:hypothetical protein